MALLAAHDLEAHGRCAATPTSPPSLAKASLFLVAGGGELVVGLVVLEAGLEIALPLAVGGEGVACGLTAAGVELDKLGHLRWPSL